MRPGDVLETAVWLDGRETQQQRDQFQADAAEQMRAEAQVFDCVIGPLRWIMKKPGDERVPEKPQHIDGPDVCLLVAEADVFKAPSGNFLAELEPKDLLKLRKLTRKGYERAWQQWVRDGLVKGRCPRLTDRQADTLINDLGPDAAVAALERGSATIQ